jgi:hypothetical protein
MHLFRRPLAAALTGALAAVLVAGTTATAAVRGR